MSEGACICPPIDGYRIKARGCPVHAEKDAAHWAKRDQEGQPPPDPLTAVVSAIKTHNDTPITAENLRWASTHEALCRSWIFDVLTGLADALDPPTTARPTPTDQP
jgi:hypothetical protein